MQNAPSSLAEALLAPGQHLPYVLTCVLIGAGTLGLALINVLLYKRFTSDAAATAAASPLARNAWGVSVVSLLALPYAAPVAIAMAGLAIARANGDQPSLLKRPAWIALVNSAWALFTLLVILAMFLGPWNHR